MHGPVPAAWDIYTKELLPLRYGHPLWYPEPSPNFGEVRIGDVGYLREGHFTFLFNTMQEANHPVNARRGVPSGFEVFNPKDLMSTHLPDAITQSHLLSKNLRSTSISAAASASEPGIAATAGLRYECTEASGALLMLKQSAHRTYIDCTLSIRKYVAAHMSSWLDFANGDLGIGLEEKDILFISGHTKTSIWAETAFEQRSSGGELIVAGGCFVPSVSGEFRVSLSHCAAAMVHAREGPADRVAAWKEGVEPVEKYDQSIFINYYRMKTRRFRSPTVLRAAAGPHSLPDDDTHDEDPEPCSWGSSVLSEDEELDTVEDDYDPVNALLDYILKHSDARTAWATDDDLGALFQNRSLPDNLEAALEALAPQLHVDDDGFGTVVIPDDAACPILPSNAESVPSPAVNNATSEVHRHDNRLSPDTNRTGPPFAHAHAQQDSILPMRSRSADGFDPVYPGHCLTGDSVELNQEDTPLLRQHRQGRHGPETQYHTPQVANNNSISSDDPSDVDSSATASLYKSTCDGDGPLAEGTRPRRHAADSVYSLATSSTPHSYPLSLDDRCHVVYPSRFDPPRDSGVDLERHTKHRPQRLSDHRRHVEEVQLEEPIIFSGDQLLTCGDSHSRGDPRNYPPRPGLPPIPYTSVLASSTSASALAASAGADRSNSITNPPSHLIQAVLAANASGLVDTPPPRKRSVSAELVTGFLEDWLREHLPRPLPSEASEKKQLCHASGLSMSQASNRMINALRPVLALARHSTAGPTTTTTTPFAMRFGEVGGMGMPGMGGLGVPSALDPSRRIAVDSLQFCHPMSLQPLGGHDPHGHVFHPRTHHMVGRTRVSSSSHAMAGSLSGLGQQGHSHNPYAPSDAPYVTGRLSYSGSRASSALHPSSRSQNTTLDVGNTGMCDSSAPMAESVHTIRSSARSQISSVAQLATSRSIFPSPPRESERLTLQSTTSSSPLALPRSREDNPGFDAIAAMHLPARFSPGTLPSDLPHPRPWARELGRETVDDVTSQSSPPYPAEVYTPLATYDEPQREVRYTLRRTHQGVRTASPQRPRLEDANDRPRRHSSSELEGHRISSIHTAIGYPNSVDECAQTSADIEASQRCTTLRRRHSWLVESLSSAGTSSRPSSRLHGTEVTCKSLEGPSEGTDLDYARLNRGAWQATAMPLGSGTSHEQGPGRVTSPALGESQCPVLSPTTRSTTSFGMQSQTSYFSLSSDILDDPGSRSGSSRM